MVKCAGELQLSGILEKYVGLSLPLLRKHRNEHYSKINFATGKLLSPNTSYAEQTMKARSCDRDQLGKSRVNPGCGGLVADSARIQTTILLVFISWSWLGAYLVNQSHLRHSEFNFMKPLVPFIFTLTSFFISALLLTEAGGAAAEKDGVYIVYMGAAPSTKGSLRDDHAQLMTSLLKRKKNALVHSYNNGFSGFAARLSAEEAHSIAQRQGVVSVFPDPVLELHTTRSWDFLNVQTSVVIDSNPDSNSNSTSHDSDAIIGILDTGIWPESESFNDKAMGPIPSRWNGTCAAAQDFNTSNCNKKIIGARSYDVGERSVIRDCQGRIPRVKNSCIQRNDGPDPGSVVNAAPWIITVAASTIDRDFESDVVLGDNTVIKGGGIHFADIQKSPGYPIIYAKSAKKKEADINDSRNCHPDSLDQEVIKGKIVVCENLDGLYSPSQKKDEVKKLGGVGAVLIDDESRQIASSFGTFPASVIRTEDNAKVLSYINSTKNPVATILRTTSPTKYTPAPVIAYFSSRGPSTIPKNILKPDIAAPGVNILAAWIANDTAEAPEVKSKHPTWSPSAIRSAIMTTATQINNLKAPITTEKGVPATPYDFGAGEVSPTGPLEPGLVYETTVVDYLNFLCYHGYNITRIKNIAKTIPDGFTCPEESSNDLISNINYPSIAISNFNKKAGRKVNRTLTSVTGDGKSVYTVSIDAPADLNVQVVPDKLQFTKNGDKSSYQVSFSATNPLKKDVFGSITWSNGKYKVRSPFAFNEDVLLKRPLILTTDLFLFLFLGSKIILNIKCLADFLRRFALYHVRHSLTSSKRPQNKGRLYQDEIKEGGLVDLDEISIPGFKLILEGGFRWLDVFLAILDYFREDPAGDVGQRDAVISAIVLNHVLNGL
ncbi:hypothetical protein V6N11_026042 [Hibiscus sabdariffa]|uniref:Uncharacterized protein n=1 Tax=Hibiscus sabdariffa TaxID=183260 RepID=A0ABR2SUH8_9ROSI